MRLSIRLGSHGRVIPFERSPSPRPLFLTEALAGRLHPLVVVNSRASLRRLGEMNLVLLGKMSLEQRQRLSLIRLVLGPTLRPLSVAEPLATRVLPLVVAQFLGRATRSNRSTRSTKATSQERARFISYDLFSVLALAGAARHLLRRAGHGFARFCRFGRRFLRRFGRNQHLIELLLVQVLRVAVLIHHMVEAIMIRLNRAGELTPIEHLGDRVPHEIIVGRGRLLGS
mmetsp:Transcript_91054/g.259980  ORF Transcript_91054/g.259980 Transcript_91054/m.259980 type:complete len:228 (-) Transcript_91054:513-1196(-)